MLKAVPASELDNEVLRLAERYLLVILFSEANIYFGRMTSMPTNQLMMQKLAINQAYGLYPSTHILLQQNHNNSSNIYGITNLHTIEIILIQTTWD